MDLYNLSMRFYTDIDVLAGATGVHATRSIRLANRDYYCLQYNHSGLIRVQIDDTPVQEVRGPSILVTYPHGRFVFGVDGVEGSGSWHHNYVSFSGARVEQYIASGLLPVKRPLQLVSDSSAVLAAFESCVEHTRAGRHDGAVHALEGILLLVRDQGASSADSDLPSWRQVRQLARSMRARPTCEWDLSREAERAHLSLAHLRRLFKQITGQAPGQHILQCRLAFAADALANTPDPIKQIAEEAGLGSVHYFTRVFRRQYHVPPARFRQGIQGRR